MNEIWKLAQEEWSKVAFDLIRKYSTAAIGAYGLYQQRTAHT